MYKKFFKVIISFFLSIEYIINNSIKIGIIHFYTNNKRIFEFEKINDKIYKSRRHK